MQGLATHVCCRPCQLALGRGVAGRVAIDRVAIGRRRGKARAQVRHVVVCVRAPVLAVVGGRGEDAAYLSFGFFERRKRRGAEHISVRGKDIGPIAAGASGKAVGQQKPCGLVLSGPVTRARIAFTSRIAHIRPIGRARPRRRIGRR